MGTPSNTPGATKNLRVTPEVHARLSRLANELNGTLDDAIRFLFDKESVRIRLRAEQEQRWRAAAKANGQSVPEFVITRVEAALQYGADPGALRRIHDMCHALTKAAGVIPQQSTPGADAQIISGEHRTR